MPLPTTTIHSWTRDHFYLSTDPNLIDRNALNNALASDQLPWACRLSEDELTTMIDRSINFGLYATNPVSSQDPSSDEAAGPSPGRTMIGFSRIMTDCVTSAYLTDVYVLPEYRSQGLAGWMMDAVKAWWEMMPSGRRLILIASEGNGEAFYAKKLMAGRMEDEVREEGAHRYRLFTVAGMGKRV